MRILILANNDVGLYKFRKELIEYLLNQGCNIYISLPYGEFVDYFVNLGCTFINTSIDRRGVNPKRDLLLLNQYKRIMKEINPNIVITYTIKPNIYGGIASRLTGKEYVVNITGLGTAFEKKGILQLIVVTLYKYALKKAKIVYFENSSNRDKLVSLKCCEKEKTVVLNGAGVNTDYYCYQPYKYEKKLKFLFIGRVMKEKGVDELFEAMIKLVEAGEDCFLDVVGPLEENYKEKMSLYEKKGWLKYHGYQADVRPYIRECGCFILPSYHEGMANTNLECASSGRPIITSNIPGCKEAVIDGVSGFLCEPRNVESLFDAMLKMINAENREEMGKNGRNLAKDVFDKKKIIDETMCYLFS